jgi:hypothetical protein
MPECVCHQAPVEQAATNVPLTGALNWQAGLKK